jgi:HEPN domain-containing protein
MTALDLAKEWLRYAKSDLHTANHMFYDVNPRETEISCYHTQQCAEKSLKAYLISKDIDPPHIHDLVELNQLCTAQELSFSNIQHYCVFLNPYGVHTRYPNELAVDDTITKQAIENTKKIFDFCEKLINGTITTTDFVET